MLNFNKKNKPTSKEKLADYKEAARDWEHDKWKSLIRSRSLGWMLAAVFLLTSVIESFAIMSLAPGKEKIPYLLRVDNSTGIVDEMVTLYDDEEMKSNKALTRYWIKKYIDAKEGYDFKFVEEDYKTVYFMSEAKIAEEFKTNYQINDPISKYGDQTRIRIKIKTLELLDDNKAVIRFLKETISADGKTVEEHYLARVSYTFLDGAVAQSIRDINPLAFLITSYSVTPENYND